MESVKVNLRNFNNIKIEPTDIKNTISSFNGVSNVIVDNIEKTVLIDYDETKTSFPQLMTELDENRFIYMDH